jgi:hypothetical protein
LSLALSSTPSPSARSTLAQQVSHESKPTQPTQSEQTSAPDVAAVDILAPTFASRRQIANISLSVISRSLERSAVWRLVLRLSPSPFLGGRSLAQERTSYRSACHLPIHFRRGRARYRLDRSEMASRRARKYARRKLAPRFAFQSRSRSRPNSDRHTIDSFIFGERRHVNRRDQACG